MRTLPISDLLSEGNIRGLRFWGRSEYEADKFQVPDDLDHDIASTSKPSGGLWLSSIIDQTDAWKGFLDSAGWNGRIEHEVILRPDTLVLVLHDESDADEYVFSFCDPVFPGISQLQRFSVDKFREAGHSALYVSDPFLVLSRNSKNRFAHYAWDVPSLWVSSLDCISEVRRVRVNL